MSSYMWPNDDGWPYPDGADDVQTFDGSVDDDALLLRMAPTRLFADLDPMERTVLISHYGLDGSAPRSMKQLHHDLGVPRSELRESLAGGLAKLRTRLAE